MKPAVVITVLHAITRIAARERDETPTAEETHCTAAARNSTWDPVCYYGRTFENIQTLLCHQFVLLKKHMKMGKCDTPLSDFDPCMMRNRFRYPVCGTDNFTYQNRWHLACETVFENYPVLKHYGECNVTCPYSTLFNPVIGSDRSQYNNAEAVACKLLKYAGRHIRVDKIVSKMWDGKFGADAYEIRGRICASDGITYKSIATAGMEKMFQTDLKVLHQDDCTLEEILDKLNESEICRVAEMGYFMHGQVCGSDNVTYNNIYKLACAAVKQTSLQFQRFGPCDAPLEETCNGTVYVPGKRKIPPFCGSNGVTYYGNREFECARKSLGIYKVGNRSPCVEGQDPCQPLESGQYLSSWYATCGTDGLTYSGEQALLCAAKTKPGLTKFHNGYCF